MSKKELTVEEEKSLCDDYRSMTLFHLSRKYKISEKKARDILQANGERIRSSSERIHHRIGKTFSDEEEQAICREYQKNSILEISKKYHVSLEKIKDVLKKHNVQIRKRGTKLKL